MLALVEHRLVEGAVVVAGRGHRRHLVEAARPRARRRARGRCGCRRRSAPRWWRRRRSCRRSRRGGRSGRSSPPRCSLDPVRRRRRGRTGRGRRHGDDPVGAPALDEALHPVQRPCAAEHEDRAVAVVDELLDEVPADETGRAGHEVRHGRTVSAGNDLGQSRPELLRLAAEHDLVPARDRGAAAFFLTGRRDGSGARSPSMASSGPRSSATASAASSTSSVSSTPARARLVEVGLDRLVGRCAEHVVTERELVVSSAADGREPADARLGRRPRRPGRRRVADQPAGVVVVEDHEVAGLVEGELGEALATLAREAAGQRPAAVLAAPGVPGDTSGSTLRSRRWPVIASPRVRLRRRRLAAGPADRGALGALGDVLALGEHRGGVGHDLLDGGLARPRATDSGVSPARILAWMSRGRSMLSICGLHLGRPDVSGRGRGLYAEGGPAVGRRSSTVNSGPAPSCG